MKKIVILTAAYNVSKWIDLYVSILKHQTYKNFEVYFIDDASTDNTFSRVTELTKDDSRFNVFKNKINVGSPLANIIKGFDLAQPHDDDIIINLDGDDWLSSVFTLDYINQFYQANNCWMTYGSYQIYPSGDIGGHSSYSFPPQVIKENSYKRFPFITSHLRTYKSWLFKKINRNDLIDPTTNKVYSQASDLALMFPMLEMSGEKAMKIDAILYNLNRENELSEATLDLSKQKETELRIRSSQKVYDRL